MNNSRLEFVDTSLERLAVLPMTPDLWEYIKSLEKNEHDKVIEMRRDARRNKAKQVMSRIIPGLEKMHDKICIYKTYSPDKDASDEYYEYRSIAVDLGLLPEYHVEMINQWDFEGFDFCFILISKTLKKMSDNRFKAQVAEMQSAMHQEVNSEEWGILFESEPTKNSVIYFLLFKKSRLIKIGYTSQIEKRLQAYATHSAEKFSLIKTVPGTKSKEKNIHKHLKTFRRKGEFFQECDEVMEYIDSL
jgi:hypothetical protein